MKVKISFVDFWNGFDPEGFILTKALRENHSVEIQDNPEDADYVFFSVFGDKHWFLPECIIKIFYTGENVCPDFNVCDYAVGFEYLQFGDRYLRIPNNYCTPFFLNSTLLMEKRQQPEDKYLLDRDFCSFVVSNSDAHPIRQEMFEQLSKYKTVDSGGRFMNNVGGPVDDKIEFHSKHKFVICFENSCHPGYTTEKIFDAFAAGCIPIYWGDPEITRVFNPDSFINVTELGIDRAIEKVKCLDKDNDLYLKMLKASPLLNTHDNTYDNIYRQALSFMNNIVDAPIDKARRYNREFWGRKIKEKQCDLIISSKRSLKDILVNGLIKRIK